MQNVSIKRYANPKAIGWAGWIEPDDRSWIMFIGLDGRPLVFLHRDPETGGVLPDDPDEREKHLEVLRAERERQSSGGGHIGQEADGTADYGPDGRDPLVPGERIFPLGIDGTGGVGVLPLPPREK